MDIKDITVESLASMTLEEKKMLFLETLNSCNRPLGNLVKYISERDFFTAPSSSKYHGNYVGGLVDHSLLVCKLAIETYNTGVAMKPSLANTIDINSVIFVALVHDICKVSFYVPETRRKLVNGVWVDSEEYKIEDVFPIGHGEKSVILLLGLGVALNTDEMLAIRWHMGAWDGAAAFGSYTGSYRSALNNCPLLGIIQCADSMSTTMLEDCKK